MKKILFILLTFFSFGLSFAAYQPTAKDLQQIKILKAQLRQIASGNMKDTRNFYSQIKSLQNTFSSHEKLNYFLREMGNSLSDDLLVAKSEAKRASKSGKIAFVERYLTGPLQEISSVDSCQGRYNTLDTLSFVNDFPTALTIATRYRETNCGFYLPANGDGPFQIISKDYGSAPITEEKFVQTVQDFIDFSKAKHQQYKSKLGINLTYATVDWTGLINHAGLYNGGVISGGIVQANNPRYLRDGYGSAYSGASRYGLIPKFLKVLKRELENNY